MSFPPQHGAGDRSPYQTSQSGLSCPIGSRLSTGAEPLSNRAWMQGRVQGHPQRHAPQHHPTYEQQSQPQPQQTQSGLSGMHAPGPVGQVHYGHIDGTA
jgi:hypothetical protein